MWQSRINEKEFNLIVSGPDPYGNLRVYKLHLGRTVHAHLGIFYAYHEKVT